MKVFLPISVDVSQSRIVMIGGGHVALQKLRRLTLYTENISVCAKEILPDIEALPISCIESVYDPSLLAGARLVYACTDDRELNRQICEDGRKAGALVNAADDPDNCDFVSPAIFRHEEMSVAVSSNGRDVNKSVRWRNQIGKYILENLISD
jgi:precorrin-2 dehydrogenase / sirohydrochlorin ferrochelatase